MKNLIEITKDIDLIANEYGIEKQKAESLIGNLPQIQDERIELERQYDEIIKMDVEDLQTSKLARELRIRIRDNRTKGITVWHKTTKDYFLKGGQFVDAIKRKEEAVNIRMEEALEQIEKYAETKREKERQELRAKRKQELDPYKEFVPFGIDLGIISDEEYLKIFNGSKLQYEADIEAKKQEEIKRLELEKIRDIRNNKIGRLLPYSRWIENFNDFDFDQITDEQIDSLIEEVKNKQQEERILREKAEKEAEEAKKKLEEERAMMQEQLRIEREKQAKIQEELRKKEAEEEKRKKEEQQKQRKLKNASDKVILNDIAHNVKNLPTLFPEVKGEEAKAIMVQTIEYLNKVAKYIIKEAENLTK